MAEDRRDLREQEKVSITVSGQDLKGHPFEEQTESVDISAVGISFYIKTSISPRSFISIKLNQSKLFGYLGTVSAVVIRIDTISSENKLVAAEFI